MECPETKKIFSKICISKRVCAACIFSSLKSACNVSLLGDFQNDTTLHKRQCLLGLTTWQGCTLLLFIIIFYMPEFPVHNCSVVQYIYYPNTNIEGNQNSKSAVVFKLSLSIFIQHRVHISRTWKYFSLVYAVTFRPTTLLCEIVIVNAKVSVHFRFASMLSTVNGIYHFFCALMSYMSCIKSFLNVGDIQKAGFPAWNIHLLYIN